VAYFKIVRSGAYVEVFKYENTPIPFVRRKKSRRFNTRRHSKNVRRARTTFFRLVQANLAASKPPALLTLTMRDIVPLTQSYKLFTRFIQKLRYRNTDLVFIAVPEFQKRGAVHFHLLVWGYDYGEIVSERNTRRIAELWQHGFVDISPTDGSTKLAGYLTKYMSKTMRDERLFGQKSYTVSRNAMRPVSMATSFSTAVFTRAFKLSTLEPLQSREYQTKWLGRCNLTVYNI